MPSTTYTTMATVSVDSSSSGNSYSSYIRWLVLSVKASNILRAGRKAVAVSWLSVIANSQTACQCSRYYNSFVIPSQNYYHPYTFRLAGLWPPLRHCWQCCAPRRKHVCSEGSNLKCLFQIVDTGTLLLKSTRVPLLLQIVICKYIVIFSYIISWRVASF